MDEQMIRRSLYFILGMLIMLSILAAYYKYLVAEEFSYESIPVEEFELEE